MINKVVLINFGRNPEMFQYDFFFNFLKFIDLFHCIKLLRVLKFFLVRLDQLATDTISST